MLDYIDERIDAFDKEDPTCGGTNTCSATYIILKFD